MTSDHDEINYDGIAVIGMAGRFPGASDIYEFWENLCEGIESIHFFSDDELDQGIPEKLKNDSMYIKARGIIDNVESFDARFFGMNAQESEIMDPQNRIFLEIAWHALENAGYDPEVYDGLVGVFAGMGNNTYYINNVLPHPEKVSAIGEFQTQIANEKDYLSTRVSYKMNLKGPSISINTACSTSLVAVSYACDSLLSYQCDMALAGGVSITFPQNSGYLYKEVNIFSRDGHCRPFDSKASGTVSGNGAALVVLKRLEEAIADGDLIYGVIKGSAVNNDGSAKMSYMAPSVVGQSNVISMALANSELDPTDISYIETHGTATVIGDPIEFEALKQVYGDGHDLKGFCGIGSIKSNIGHLDTAAGVAGLIKTILSLYHGKIPATLNYEAPNPQINLEDSPFYVNSTLSKWPEQKSLKRAAVSSFGVGGTNAHVIVEQAPDVEASGPSRPVQLLTFSARSNASLDGTVENLFDYLKKNQRLNLADVAYTLQTSRKKFNCRKVFVCNDITDIDNWDNRCFASTEHMDTENPGIVFMFPGQGSHYVNMGLSFYQHESVFRETVDTCSKILEPVLGIDIRKIIFPGDTDFEIASDELQKTCYNQPAIFTIEYALFKLLDTWGIKPSAMVGHSIGEYVAATIAGVFTLEDALEIVAARGRLMQEMPSGSMLSVFVSGDETLKRLPESLSLAAVNAPSFSVVSGKTEDIETFKSDLIKEGIKCRILKTSHAYHSTMMDPVVVPFKSIIEQKYLSKPSIPFVSIATGEWITDNQATDSNYWANHLRRPVLFSKAVKTLEDNEQKIMLEVGPRTTLTFLAKEHYHNISEKKVIPILSDTFQGQTEWFSILSAVGQLWIAGIDLDWSRFYQYEKRNKCPLSGYCFEKQSYWLEPGNMSIGSSAIKQKKDDPQSVLDTRVKTDQEFVSNIDIESVLTGIWNNVLPDVKKVKHSDNFFDLGGHSLLAVQFFSEIKRKTGIDLQLSTLFEAPTFGGLLELLKRELQKVKQNTTYYSGKYTSDKGVPTWCSLVSIKTGGTKPPFFCVHGIGGNVLNYVPLSSFVDAEQPFYGLQARGIDGMLEPYSSIEQMAEKYISEIKRVQPKGPYYLGGGSMGGLISYEMAQQLQQEGETVGLLAMFDTYGPAETDAFFHHNRRKLSSHYWGKMYLYYEKIKSKRFIDKVLLIKRSVQFHLNYRKNLAMVKLFRFMKKPLPYKIRFWYVEQKNILVSKIYKAKNYKGRILLFRATAEKNRKGFDPSNGWEGMASDGIEIIEIPGNHENIVEHPLLGECLATSLKKAQDILVNK